MIDFVHLHNHTEYSMLDSVMKIDDFIVKAKELGMKALAITDHGNMYGAFKFYNACKKADIKPIIGCEVYVVNDLEEKERDNIRHLVLIAKNDVGYHNLIKIVSEGSEHFYYKPRVDHNIIRKYSEGLICMSACISGEIPKLLLEDKDAEAEKVLQDYLDIFGTEDFYIEIQNHHLASEKIAFRKICLLAEKYNLKVVATNDIHYLNKEDKTIQDILHCIQSGDVITDTKAWIMETDECYFRTGEEMYELFHNYRNCISNTLEIANKCNVEIKTKQKLSPTFGKIPEGFNEETYLRYLCEQTIGQKYSADMLEVAQKRLDYELDVIKNMGFSGYFLIVWDFINWSRQNNIAIGPGRGSGAGSIVCYLTGITELDPLKLNLLFERFLNPERVSMPDIDTDIADIGRDKVEKYMMETYHYDKSAKIVTFQTMAAKGSVRNVTKVLGYSYQFGDDIAKMITADTIQASLEENVTLADFYKTNADCKKVIDYAMKIEGLPRQIGSHAAGVVISSVPLKEAIPVSIVDDVLRTSYDKDEVEKIGLLKMDLLGLKNLSIIEDAKTFIKEKYNVDIDFNNIPWDDKKTMDMLCAGDTFGVFQLESSGMTDLVKKLAPRCYEDLIPLVALYRPGPLGSGMVDDFVECRHGRQQIKYMHPLLEPILKETYGVILYQEQVMQVVQSLAGFSLGKADLMRRAMGHKEPELLKQQRNDFVEGCIKNNIGADLAGQIFDLLMHFASYGFNKSHSAAYGYLAYQTAYLKANYPLEYISAYISHSLDNPEKLAVAMNLCRQKGIHFLLPDVTKSEYAFKPEGNNIRIGFGTIKNLGKSVADIIITARNEAPFESVSDFIFRCLDVTGKNAIQYKNFKSLCELKAFSSLGGTDTLALYSKEVFEGIKNIIKEDKKKKAKKEDTMSMSLFEFSEEEDKIKLPDTTSFYPKNYKEVTVDEKEQLKMELEHLGFYATKHPLDEFSYLNKNCISLANANQNPKDYENRIFNFYGMLTDFREIINKKNEKMAFVTISYYDITVSGVIWAKEYKTIEPLLKSGKKLFLFEKANGKIRNDKFQVVITKAKALD